MNVTFEGLSPTFESSSNVSYNTNMLTFIPIGVNTCTYRLRYAYKVDNFYIKPPCLLDDNYKFNANVRDKDHKITKIHHFVA